MEGVVINLTKSEVSSIFDMNRIQFEKEIRPRTQPGTNMESANEKAV